MASIGALLDHLVRERAVSSLEDEGIHSLDVRDIEIVSLYEFRSQLPMALTLTLAC